MNMRIAILVLVLASPLLTACSGIMDSAQPAKQIYLLMPLSDSAQPPQTETGPTLAISLDAVPGLDSDWIQALSHDARLTRYANARWPDYLPEVLTSVIQRSLASSGRFSSVERSSRVRGNGWKLQLQVEKFYGLQDSAGQTNSVAAEVYGSIQCNDHSSSFALGESVGVSGERLSAVVAAHQQALDDVTQQLLKAIFEACS